MLIDFSYSLAFNTSIIWKPEAKTLASTLKGTPASVLLRTSQGMPMKGQVSPYQINIQILLQLL